MSALGLGLACHTPSTKLPLDPKSAATDEDEPAGEASSRPDPLPVEAVADLLPAETMGLIEFSDPGEFLALLAPLDEFPQFNMVRGEVRSRLGVDPFEPEGWRAAGLDPDGPVGMGLLELDSRSGFAYAKLSDPQAFEALLDKLMGGSSLTAAVEVGQGRMIRINDDLNVIMREGYVVAVLSERAERAKRDYSATVATIDPREALSRDPGFAWVRERREAEDDALLFVAPQTIFAEARRELSGSTNDFGVRRAREALEDARRAGESADRIRELERQLEDERAWQRRRDAEQEAALELARRVMASMGAAFIAGDLHGSGAEFHAGALIPGANVFRDLFVPVSAESPLLRALDEPLLAAIDGQADVDKLIELIDLVAEADGESLTEINAEVHAELGVNLLSDVVPALDGRGGFMLTESKPIDPSKIGMRKLDPLRQSLGIAAYLGLRDPKPIEALFDRLANDPRSKGVFTRARGGGWTLDVPEWREVELRIVDDELIVSTDDDFATRVDKAQAGSQAAALAEADHPLRGPVPTPALRMYQRWRWIALTSARSPWLETVDGMLSDMDSHHTLTPEEAAKVPKSKAFKKKYKELEQVIDDLNAFNLERTRKEFELALEITEALGELGIQVERVNDGLAAYGSWRMAPGTNPVVLGARMMMMGRATDWTSLDQLQSRRYELREELWKIRQADLDAAAAKRN